MRQQARTRSLEEEGSRLRRQLAEGERVARDVAGAVDERLNQHLPTILEAAEPVRHERVSQPGVEQAPWGWVPAGYGPPSTANLSFREICAILVCASVPRVDSPPFLRLLLRRLRLPIHPVLRLPTEAVGRGPQQGMPTVTRPMGRAPGPRDGLVATPTVPAAGPLGTKETPGSHSGGDTTPTAADKAGVASSTPARDELRALLVYLNVMPPDLQTGEAQKLHLHLTTRLDLPRKFPQSNLRSQYTALGKHLPTRPELGKLVGQFVQDRRAAPAAPQDSAPDRRGRPNWRLLPGPTRLVGGICRPVRARAALITTRTPWLSWSSGASIRATPRRSSTPCTRDAWAWS